MTDPRLADAVKRWIEGRAPALLGRVSPLRADPAATAPLLVYEWHDHHQYGGLGGDQVTGLSGLAASSFSLTLWDTDYARGAALTHKLNGRRDDPGLNGLRAALPFAGLADLGYADGEVLVNPCLLVAGSAAEYDEVDADGQETGWKGFTATYRIHYAEG